MLSTDGDIALVFGRKMKVIVYYLIWVFASSGLVASPLWNGSHSEMSSAEVRRMFPRVVVPKEPSKLQGGFTEKLQIPELIYLGEKFQASFYFDRDSLHQVTLRLLNKRKHRKMVELGKRIVVDLSTNLGKPTTNKETVDGASARFEVEWVNENQRVSIIVISTGSVEELYDPICFNINYQQN